MVLEGLGRFPIASAPEHASGKTVEGHENHPNELLPPCQFDVSSLNGMASNRRIDRPSGRFRVRSDLNGPEVDVEEVERVFLHELRVETLIQGLDSDHFFVNRNERIDAIYEHVSVSRLGYYV